MNVILLLQVKLPLDILTFRSYLCLFPASNSDDLGVQSDVCGDFDRLRILGMVDSGYSTTDSLKKSCGSNSEVSERFPSIVPGSVFYDVLH